jgi:pimeloyl-ACP methyl ester carboxylesterase
MGKTQIQRFGDAVAFGTLLLALCLGPGCGGESPAIPGPREVVVDQYEVTTQDNVEIALYRYTLSGGPMEPRPILLCPGFSENCLAFDLMPYSSMARFLAARGIETWVIDFRGRGASGVPPGTTDRNAPWSVDDFGFLDIGAAAPLISRLSPSGRFFLLGFSEGDVASTAYLLEGDPGVVCGHIALAPAIVLGATAEDPDADWPPSQFLFNALHPLEPIIPLDLFIPFRELVRGLYEIFLELGLVEWALQVDLWNILWNMENMTDDMVITVLQDGLGDISGNVLKQFLRGADYEDRRGICSFTGSALEQKAGPFCYTDRLQELDTATLVLAGSVDMAVPSVNARYVYDRLTVEDKSFRVFGLDHGDAIDYGHDDLTFGVHAEEDVFPVIAEWLLDRMQ